MPKKLEDINLNIQDITTIIPGLPEPSLYIDFANDPLDMSSNNTTVSYENNVVSSQEIIGPANSIFNYASFDDSSDANGIVRYDSSDNPLAFTDGVSNYPFSICFWFNTRNPEGLEGLFSFQGLAQQRGAVTCRYQTTDIFRFYIYFTATANDYIRTAINLSPLDPENDWIHVAITYDGTNTLGTGSNRSIKIYLNGSLVPSGVVAGPGYTGNPAVKYADTLYLGAFNSGWNELDGSYSQFMWFSNIVLSDPQINSIYNANNLVTQENLKSGYLNNPVRTVIRDVDNRSSRYPTVHRMNRRGTSGILNNIQFKDDKTVKFGTRIKDNFNIRDLSTFSRSVDSGLWETSDGMIIRREFDPKGDYTVTEGALVFEGGGDSEGRWIKTKNKVAKPTIWFNAIAGPYNNYDSVLGSLKLGLDQGAITDILKVQVSYDGSTGWTTVPIKSSYLSHSDAENLVLNDGLNPQGILFNASANQQISLTPEQKKPLVYVQIPMEAFAELGYHDPFHVRFVQPSVSSTTRKVWAIGQIDIMSRNEQVLYPKLSKLSDEADRYFLSSSISNPNFAGALITTGSALPGITDDEIVFNTNQNEQKNTPFNDSIVLNVENNDFYKEGTSEDVIPGFSSPLLSKTKFEIDLSPSEEVDAGLTTLMLGYGPTLTDPSNPWDDTGNGQILMTYWNNNLKKWEKIGQPMGVGLNNFPAPDINSLLNVLSSSAVGFGPNLLAIAESIDGYEDSPVSIFNKESLNIANKPITTFSFPYGPQYHATGSQSIKARSLGITKPFLLEKIKLNFDIKLELPGGGDPEFSYIYSYVQKYIHRITSGGGFPTPSPSATDYIRGWEYIVPTFFILKQNLNNFDIKSDQIIGLTTYSVGNQYSYETSIPDNYIISSGSNTREHVNTSRDLVTYTQPAFSFEFNNFSSNGLNIDLNNLKEAGMPGDKIIHIDANQNRIDGVTVSDYYEFTGSNIEITDNVKNVAKYSHATPIRVFYEKPSTSDWPLTNLFTSKDIAGRTNSDLDDNRAFVNGKISFDPSENKLKVPSINESSQPELITIPTTATLVQTSPYLIDPDDDLILGWQYPMPKDMVMSHPSTVVNGFYKMTLFGNSKLTLFGSQVKDGKEFHEGINQNLTSDVIHEVIGNEPVIDQWQIASRGEMTGSFGDQFHFALATEKEYGTGVYTTGLAFSGLIPPPSDEITDSGTIIPNTGGMTIHDTYARNPVTRIRSSADGTPGRNNFSILGLNNSSLGRSILALDKIDDAYVGTPARPNNYFITNIQRFVKLSDISKIYKDSFIRNREGTYMYGSSQNYTYISGASSFIAKLGGNPKYYYNLYHYGYFSDSIRQGLDSNFVFEGDISKGKQLKPIGIDAPVKTQFVQEIDDSETGLKFKSYTRVRPSDIDGTSYQTFQSSNLSLTSISEVPFFDDGIVRNREYGEENITISV
jgi:hypothetical protein